MFGEQPGTLASIFVHGETISQIFQGDSEVKIAVVVLDGFQAFAGQLRYYRFEFLGRARCDDSSSSGIIPSK